MQEFRCVFWLSDLPKPDNQLKGAVLSKIEFIELYIGL